MLTDQLAIGLLHIELYSTEGRCTERDLFYGIRLLFTLAHPLRAKGICACVIKPTYITSYAQQQTIKDKLLKSAIIVGVMKHIM